MEENHSKQIQWKHFIKGEVSPRFMGKYFFSVLAFYILVILLARSVFPGGYSALDHTISTQGGIADNPRGWWIYCGGIIIIGIALIPYIFYLYQRLKPTLLPVSRMVLFFGVTGCIGFTLLGVFPHDYPIPHDFATGMAFGGFIFAAVLTFPVLIWKLKQKSSWPSKRGFYLAYIHWWVMVVLIITLQEWDNWFDMSAVDPRWFDYPASQWSAMITILIWMIGMYLNSRKAIVSPPANDF